MDYSDVDRRDNGACIYSAQYMKQAFFRTNLFFYVDYRLPEGSTFIRP